MHIFFKLQRFFPVHHLRHGIVAVVFVAGLMIGVGNIPVARAADLSISACIAQGGDGCFYPDDTETLSGDYDKVGTCVGSNASGQRLCLKKRASYACNGIGEEWVTGTSADAACDGFKYQHNAAAASNNAGKYCCVKNAVCESSTTPLKTCTSASSCNTSTVGIYTQPTAVEGYCSGGSICCQYNTSSCVGKGGQCIGGAKPTAPSGYEKDVHTNICKNAGDTCFVKSDPNANQNSTDPNANQNSTDPNANQNSTDPNANQNSTAHLETITFKDPLKYETVQDFLGQGLLSFVQRIVAILALIFLLIGSIFYITSAGDESRIKFGKGAIAAALIGFAIALAAPTFLKEIAGILGWGANDANTTAVAGALSLGTILIKTLNFLLGITGFIALIMVLIGGLMYLSSAGDEDRLDSAKDIVQASLIGIVLAFSALILVKQIATLFGVGGV